MGSKIEQHSELLLKPLFVINLFAFFNAFSSKTNQFSLTITHHFMHTSLLRTLLLFLLPCFFQNVLQAQMEKHPIADKILQHQSDFKSLASTQIFDFAPMQALKKAQVEAIVKDATFLNVSESELKNLLKKGSEFLTLELPQNGQTAMKLELYKAEVFAPGFQIYTASNPSEPFLYERGSYYWGIVNRDEHSLAALSFTQDEVMGLIQFGGETFTVGKMENETTHIFYKEKDLLIAPTQSCGTDDDIHFVGGKETTGAMEKSASNCVQMYIEVDYDIFVGKGGVAPATNYVAGAFSQVAILYANEAINFTVSEILVWDVVDPYTGTTTSNYLTQFRDNLNGNYNGDLAHLVGYTGSGGIAYVDVLCNGFYGVGYSDINATYNNVPAYSWTVEVLTHEIGHNLGSRHTHDCVWNGNNTAIDGCGPAAGYGNSCGGGPIPAKGTIMSYCHLVGGVGIDFNLGFGPQPGDLIRSRVYNASCLSACASSTPDDAGITGINAPTGSYCANSLSPQVELFNFGSNNLTSVTIQYSVDGGATSNYNWSGNLASNTGVNVTLPAISFGVGSHTFAANTTNPNGNADTNSSNDGSSSAFSRPADQTFYADNDGDGYGDPNNSITDCSAPNGYVSNNTDCNDANASQYPGAPCSDGDVCTTGDVLDSNCNCVGTSQDSDGDGVCDALDVCPGGDDNEDFNGNGIPDFCDCSPATTSFSTNPLTHTGSGSSTTMLSFGSGDKNPFFTISDLNAKTNGNPNSRFINRVTVTYVNGNSQTITHGVYNGDQVSSVNVSINDEVQSITLALTDSYDGNYSGNMSVSLSIVDYCIGCTDSDGDGVCDGDDVCAGFDDSLIGLPCDDLDPCTINDVWSCNLCAGTLTGDSDGDGVCDGLDVCPGGDDTIDTDGDGIPDDCDAFNCSSELTNNFSPNPLNHQGGGTSTATVNFPPNNQDVSFTVNDLGAKTNGNPNKRYIDEVTVTYVDGNGATITHGTYSGSSQSSASVQILGLVQSITLSLSNGLSTNEPISVTTTDVISCLPTGAIFQEGDALSDGLHYGRLYPNPAKGEAYLQFDSVPEQVTITFSSILGERIATYEMANQSIFRFDLNHLYINEQLLFVTIHVTGQRPVTKRLLLTK